MNENRSTKRTRKLIRNAFTELLEEKGNIEKVTVKEIIERADISKSTFYAHYQDIYGLIEEFEEELIIAITSSIDLFFADKTRVISPYIHYLLSIFKENEELYRKLICSQSDSQFIGKIKSLLNTELENYITQQLPQADSHKVEFFVHFMTNGITYLTVDYFNGDCTFTLDEIADRVNKLLQKVMESIKSDTFDSISI